MINNIRKSYLGAAAVSSPGSTQADFVLVADEPRFIERADTAIIQVDVSKFRGPLVNIVCTLDAVDIVVTGDRISDQAARHGAAVRARLMVTERWWGRIGARSSPTAAGPHNSPQ